MFTPSWKCWFRPSTITARGGRRVRPVVEMLEDRLAPATFIVQGTGDATGAVTDLGGGIFSAPTLRAAIDAANDEVNFAGHDTIVFGADVFGETITALLNDTNNPFAFGPTAFVITSSITIAGNPNELGVTIDGNDSQRLFGVMEGANLTIQYLTLTGGLAQGGDGGGGFHGGGGGGGGAGLGGAIFNDGTLVIANSTFTANQAVGGAGGNGGEDNLDGGGGGGGGLAGNGSDATDSTGGSGGAGGGGAGANAGNFQVGAGGGFGGGGGGGGQGVLSHGGAGGFGGGGGGGGANPAQFSGAGGTAGFGAGGGSAGSFDDLGGAGGGGAGLGGAIFNNQGATLTIINSTLAENTAQGGAGGTGNVNGTAGQGLGGAIFNRNGTVVIVSSTLADNTADNGGALFTLADDENASATVHLFNSILADSSGGFALVQMTLNDATATIHADTPRVNIVESWANIGIGDFFNSGILLVNPQLGDLQHNGGPTMTMAIGPNSPAFNAGNNADAAGLDFDQRGTGFPRIVDDTVDIGAFELQAAPPHVHLFAVGADAGGGPHVKVYNADGSLRFSFFAFNPAFTGGARVAVGDVNGDGVDDIIVGAGPGGGPHVKVFSGVDMTVLASFFAYAPSFTGGVFVAVGNLDGDSELEVIVGAGAGGGPHVRSFKIDGGVATQLPGPLGSFFAYAPSFTGGVHVAAGNFDGTGTDEIITGAGAGGGPHVKAFRSDGVVVASFFAYAPSFTGGVWVAAGDLDDNGMAEIITGAGAGGGPHVKVFNGGDLTLRHSFFAYDADFRGGVRVGTVHLQDGGADLITGPGPVPHMVAFDRLASGGSTLVPVGTVVGPLVRLLDGLTLAQLDSFFAFNPAFLGGVFVGGSK
ncbi:MAG: choice-of-anchor Q domain-containing protein [Gemmataceae bacterium]